LIKFVWRLSFGRIEIAMSGVVWHKSPFMMQIKLTVVACLAALMFTLGCGCGKTDSAPSTVADPAASSSPPTAIAAEAGASIHWLGLKRLAAETNATTFVELWKLPESERLVAQTLDKLATAPWRLLKEGTATNDAPVALLRPLLEDLVQEESYLHVRTPANDDSWEAIFAIRLNVERADTWRTNLKAALESLTSGLSDPTKTGWRLTNHTTPKLIELSRSGEWTLVSMADEQNRLLAETLAQVEQGGTPYLPRTTNFWLTLMVDLPRLARASAAASASESNLPRIAVSMIGDGANVLTRGELHYQKPLGIELDAWNVPTNLVHEPLISFTAIRGIKPWLSSQELWKNLGMGESPNQLYLWGLGATPFQTYFALPSASASNQVFKLSNWMLNQGNLWLTANAIGNFVKLPEENGVAWSGVPFMRPTLKSVGSGDLAFLHGSFFPAAGSNRPMPVELLYSIQSRTNLVAYDWEITAPRFDGWTGVGQSLRISLGRGRMPADSAGITWLRAIKPRLGNSTTGLLMTGPDELLLVRNSSVGLTALELHLLADWLESPHFPKGLHTLFAPSDLRGLKSR
jgi:hypothetical protein